MKRRSTPARRRKAKPKARRVPKARKSAPRSRGAPEVSEEEFVREEVSKATGVHFEVVAPHPAFPLPVESLEWFMRCRNKDEITLAPYLNTVWKEKGGGIWLESLAIGDTIDWIELAYGEEQAGKSLDLDYSRFGDPSFQNDFGSKFPIVMGRIREYEGIVSKVSTRRKARLQVRHTGSKGFLVFTAAAHVVTPKGASLTRLGSAIKKSIDALREAYEKVMQV